MGALAYFDRERDVRQAAEEIATEQEDEETWLQNETVPFVK
jgi:hypothetical protein